METSIAMLSTPQLADDLDGRLITPDHPDYDKARTVFLGGIDRRPARDRPRRGRGRRRTRRRARRATPGWSSPSAAAATASPATASPTAGSCSTCADMRALEIDAERRTAWAETGLDRGRVHGRGRRARPRHRVRRHRLGRDRRDHAGRRRRLPRPQARPDDRRPAGRRARDRRRPAPARGRRDASGPVLGDPRRRRQLRRRDPVPVPAAPGRHDRRRDADPAGDARGDRVVHRRGGGRAGGALDDRQRHARAADAVPAAGVPRPAGRHGHAGLRGRGRGRRARDRAVPGARDRRSPTWSGRCRIREIYPPDDEDYRPVAEFRIVFLDAVDRARPRRSSTSSRPRPRRWRSRSSGCSAARGPRAGRRHRVRPPRAPHHGERRRDLRAPGRAAGARRSGSRALRRSCARAIRARTSASSATRERRASAPPTRDRPGTGSPRSRPATTRTTSSGSTRTSRRHSTATGGSRHPAAFEKTAHRSRG